MRLLKILLAVLAAGIASVLAVQLFYKRFYEKWRYFTLYDDAPPRKRFRKGGWMS